MKEEKKMNEVSSSRCIAGEEDWNFLLPSTLCRTSEDMCHTLLVVRAMPWFGICSVLSWPWYQSAPCFTFLQLMFCTILSRPTHLIVTMTPDLDQKCVPSDVKMWARSSFLKATVLDNRCFLHLWTIVHSRGTQVDNQEKPSQRCTI